MTNCFDPGQAPYILYGDDDPDDRLVLKETMHKVNPSVALICALDGREVFACLEALVPGQLLPSAILLDQNMPGWTGLQTLAAIKESNSYSSIPAFIFTTSDHSGLRARVVQMGATFITKPYLGKDLVSVCSVIAENCSQPPNYKR